MAQKKDQGQQDKARQGKVRLDYGRAEVRHATVCLIQGTADEVVVDFASHPLPSGQAKETILSVNTRMGMSYPTAKRLAMLLTQAIGRYERVFGTIEVDSQKRTAQLLKQGGGIEDSTARFPDVGG